MGESVVQGDRFQAHLPAASLPHEVLLDLWQRTRAGHADLFSAWYRSVSGRFGADVAEGLADMGWPQRERGASMEQLFSGDLRFTMMAAGLDASMLTVANWDEDLIPEPLRCHWLWYRGLRLGMKLRQTETAVDPDHPGRFLPGLETWKKRIRDQAFKALLSMWRRFDERDERRRDRDPLERVDVNGLSVPALAQLWNLAAVAYMMVTDRWYTTVEAHYGGDTARELELAVWVEGGAADRDLEIGLGAARSTGNDVEALLRGFQIAPGEVGILNVDFELKDSDHGILTHKTCPAIRRMEHRDEERLAHCCQICVLAMPLSGHVVSKDIQCRPLVLPPRRGPRDLACQWEYKRVSQDDWRLSEGQKH
jgi:hypothetical protein